MINSTNLNSALYSGLQGLQQSSQGITEASASIAQRSARNNDAASIVENIQQQTPTATNDLTSDVVSLQVNSINAQASARVIEVANDTLGRIIDTQA